jgi:hypothetical protein
MCQRGQCWGIRDTIAYHDTETLLKFLKLIQNREAYWRRAVLVELGKRGVNVQ